ncbi:MAG: HNH endonuclease signature motif containing protein, partial [Solirubrobacterales bacterium]
AMHHARDVACGPGGPAIPHDGEPHTPPVTNADALATMAEASLTSTASSSGGDRYQVVLHLGPDGRRELADGSTVSRQAAQRLLCDAAVLGIADADGGGSPAATKRTRTIPAALRRALRARDRGCRFPGCTHRRFLDAHHIRHWADGGETAIENLVQLCRRHHRLIHEGGFSVEREANGELVFRRRGGSAVHAKPPQIRGSAAAIASGGRRPPRLASGDPLDLDLTVECMIGVSRRAGRAAPAPATSVELESEPAVAELSPAAPG